MPVNLLNESAIFNPDTSSHTHSKKNPSFSGRLVGLRPPSETLSPRLSQDLNLLRWISLWRCCEPPPRRFRPPRPSGGFEYSARNCPLSSRSQVGLNSLRSVLIHCLSRSFLFHTSFHRSWSFWMACSLIACGYEAPSIIIRWLNH